MNRNFRTRWRAAGFKNNGTELAIEGLGIIGYGEK